MGRRRRSRLTGGRLRILLALLLLAVVAGTVVFFLRRDPERRMREEEAAAGRAMTEERYDDARVRLARILAENPRNLAARRNLLVCLVRLERLDEAAAVARETLKYAPDDPGSHSALAAIARRDGDLSAAIRHSRAAAADPNAPAGILFQLADLLLDAGRVTEALPVLLDAAKLPDTGSGIPVRLARVLERIEPESPAAIRARQYLDELIARSMSELERGESEPGRALAVADLALRAGRPDDAIFVLTAIPVRRELTGEEKLLLARACAAAGRSRRAREILGEIGPSPTGKQEAPLSETLGRASVLIETDDPRAALDLLSGALAEHPRHPGLLRLRMAALSRLLNEPDEAPDPALLEKLEGAATALLAIRPEDERALRVRAAARLDRGRVLPALDDARTLRRLAPRSAIGAWLTGVCLYRLGSAESALPLLRQGRPAAPSGEASLVLARAAALAGDVEAATGILEDPPAELTVALRAALLAVAGDPDRAESLANGEDFGSDSLEDQVLAAVALAAGGRPAPARRILAETAEIPTAESRLHRAQLYGALGDPAGRIRELVAAADTPGPWTLQVLLELGVLVLAGDVEHAPSIDAIADRLAGIPGGISPSRVLRARAALAAGKIAEAEAHVDAALAAAPSDPLALEARLMVLLEKKLPPTEILPAAEAVLEALPGHVAARRVKALALVSKLGRGPIPVDDAEATLGEAAALAPKLSGVRALRGIFGVSAGYLDVAEEDARALLATEKTTPLGHFLLSLVRYRQGRLEEAEAEIRTGIEGSPDSVPPRLVLGHILLDRGRIEEALRLSEELCRGTVTNPAALLRVRALMLAGRKEEARRFAEARARDSDPAARALLGRLLLSLDEPGEAAAIFRGLTVEFPRHLGHASSLAEALVRAGRPEEARQAADLAVKAAEDKGPAELLRARVLWSTGDPAAAIEVLREGVRAAPGSAPALALLGEILLSQNRSEEGRKNLERAAALDPRDFRSRLTLAILAEQEERGAEAQAWYEEVLAIRPDQALAANNLAFRLAKHPDQAERAVGLAEMAVAQFPDEPEFRDTLALALAAAGRHRAAADAARTAMGLAGGNAWIAVRAAEIFRAAGLPEEARAAAARAETRASPEEQSEIRRRIRDVLRGLPR